MFASYYQSHTTKNDPISVITTLLLYLGIAGTNDITALQLDTDRKFETILLVFSGNVTLLVQLKCHTIDTDVLCEDFSNHLTDN